MGLSISKRPTGGKQFSPGEVGKKKPPALKSEGFAKAVRSSATING
jgi:hypothetical protein